MSWPTVSLGDLAEIRSGGTPPRSKKEYYGGEIPWVKIGDLDEVSSFVRKTEETITEEGLKAIRGRLFPRGTLLFAIYGSVGKMSFAGVPLATNQAILGISVDQSRVDQKFLFHSLAAKRAELLSDGVGVTQKNLSSKYMRDLQLPLPPLEEQRRIAGILDAADALRRRRREALALLDTLPGAIFAEMFMLGSSTAPLFKLSELGKISTGATPPSKLDGMFDGDIPFVTPGDLDTNDPVARRVTEAGAQKSRTVPSGSTLVSCIGNIGKIRQTTERVAFNQQINAIEWSDRIVPDYGTEAIRFIKRAIQGAATSTTLPILKKSLFQMFEIPCPDRHLQEEYSKRVDNINQQREQLMSHVSELDTLFNTLQSRAFAGEL